MLCVISDWKAAGESHNEGTPCPDRTALLGEGLNEKKEKREQMWE